MQFEARAQTQHKSRPSWPVGRGCRGWGVARRRDLETVLVRSRGRSATSKRSFNIGMFGYFISEAAITAAMPARLQQGSCCTKALADGRCDRAGAAGRPKFLWKSLVFGVTPMDPAISRNGTASGLELGKFEPLGRNSPAGRAAVPCVTGLSSSGSRSSEALRGL